MKKQNITEEYINGLLPQRTPLLEEMEKYAEEHGVPIMEQTGIKLLLQILEIHQPARILEVGAAIGYSAIRMAEAVPHAEIYTMERDEERAEAARDNINKAGLSKRIFLLEGDALDLKKEAADNGPFDVLFIDAAKGQYERFFDLYAPLVLPGGLIISDNVLFKGMVSGETELTSKRVESMVNKLRKFNERLMKDSSFSSMIYPVGDGVMVSRKKVLNGGEQE
ncbi:O-methyltransferase [Evansella clarkii]|uniref:O-methyltransferase n=1 Tax=Evansella clarkii TaxID=79879 RepID=UPI000998982B|nr:O-methyltransferase [Evansella clarkii]